MDAEPDPEVGAERAASADEVDDALSEYSRASPWPLFVALGLPIAEVGILFNLLPIAVGGLLLFCGSIAGLLEESGYAASPWRPLVGLAVVCVAAGAVLVLLGPRFPEIVALATRGYAVVAAGILLLAGGLLGPVVVRDEPSI